MVPTIMESQAAKSLKRNQDLRPLMAKTHASAGHFQRFLDKCRRWSRQLKLIRNKFSHEQDPVLWKAYVERICNTERSLIDYENQWPIRVYFDLRVARHKAGKYLRQSERLLQVADSDQAPPIVASVSSSPLATITPSPPGLSTSATTQVQPTPKKPATKRRLFVGRPPPDMQRAPGVRALTHSPSPEPIRRPRVQETDASEDELITAPSSDLPWKPKIKIPSRRPRIEVVYVRCYDCGRPLGREFAGPTSQMRESIGDNEDQFSVLFEAGLVSDRHLAIFLEWSREQRELFFDCLPTSGFIRQALKSKLLAAKPLRIEKSKDLKVTWVEEVACQDPYAYPRPKQGYSGVVQPGAELEEKLTDPKEPIELLFTAMCLGDNRALFDDIMTLVEKEGEAYIWTFRPSKEQFEDVVKKIFKERIAFERYENQWPVRFILKRIARKMGTKPLDDHLTATQPPKAKQPQPQPCKKPSSSCLSPSPPPMIHISYTCPTHPGVDVGNVSPKICRVLQVLGLAELLPVFALAGIRSEEHIRQFSAFSEEEKENVVHDYRQWGRPIDLNVFQNLALKVEFTARKLGLYLQNLM